MGQRKTSLPSLFRYFLPKDNKPLNIFSLSVVSILPLSNFSHCSTRYRFILFFSASLNCFSSSDINYFLFLLFSRFILLRCLLNYLFFIQASVIYGSFRSTSSFFSFFSSSELDQISSLLSISSAYTSYFFVRSPISSTKSSDFGYDQTYAFLVTVLLIALKPQGGSVMIASKMSQARRVSLVESIRMIFGKGNPYCSKLSVIFGVKSSSFFSGLKKGDFLLILPTAYPLRTLISKSDPNVIAPLLAGGISSPPVPTKGSITMLPGSTRA